jgi:hypothetical protein
MSSQVKSSHARVACGEREADVRPLGWQAVELQRREQNELLAELLHQLRLRTDEESPTTHARSTRSTRAIEPSGAPPTHTPPATRRHQLPATAHAASNAAPRARRSRARRRKASAPLSASGELALRALPSGTACRRARCRAAAARAPRRAVASAVPRRRHSAAAARRSAAKRGGGQRAAAETGPTAASKAGRAMAPRCRSPSRARPQSPGPHPPPSPCLPTPRWSTWRAFCGRISCSSFAAEACAQGCWPCAAREAPPPGPFARRM